MSWLRVSLTDLLTGIVHHHVIPADDFREHVESLPCWCGAMRDDEEPCVIIHFAMDKREEFERGERYPS